MTETEIIKKDILYKIFIIQDGIINDLVYYGFTNKDLNLILKSYKSNYLKFCKDNKSYNYIYKIFEKYDVDKLEIILIDECIKEDIREKLKNLIKNDPNSINKKYTNSVEEIKLKGLESKKKWRQNNVLIIKDYNKDYHNKNTDKIKQYHQNIKDKLKEKKLCECGKLYCFNRKASRVIHENTKQHLNYIKSLEITI